MKRSFAQILSLVFVLTLLVNLFSGCTGTPEAGTQGSSSVVQSETARAETGSAEPTQVPPLPEAPYTFDRNNADLSAFDLPERLRETQTAQAELPWAKVVSDSELEKIENPDEIHLYQLDINNSDHIKSENYAFQFAPLPVFDAEKEQSYTFQGSRVHFIFPIEDNSIGLDILHGRNLTDEFEHAFVFGLSPKRTMRPARKNCLSGI